MFSIFNISAAGMSVEQTKLAVAASNFANAHTTKTADGGVYKPLSVSVHSAVRPSYSDVVQGLTAESLPRPVVGGVAASDAPPHLIYDPGHPDADSQGFVALPAVDPVSSMLDLMSISRAYEANLRAFDITRNLIQLTIDMGKGR